MKLRIALVVLLAFAGCKKKSSDGCSERRLMVSANIELAQNELAKQERAVDAAIASAATDSKDGLAEASRQRAKKQRLAKRRDLLVTWGAALTDTKAVAIDPNAGDTDPGDDTTPSFVAARTLMVDYVAACTRT